MSTQQIDTISEHEHSNDQGAEAPGLDHEHDHSTEALGLDHEHDHSTEALGLDHEREHDHVHEDETALRDIPITARNLPRLTGLGLIRLYQMTFSKTLASGSCRFYPTCSHYGYQAIVKHGLLKGSGLAVWRVARCQPFSKGGYDPVP